MRSDLILDALRTALTRRQAGADVDLIHHSDAGSPGRIEPVAAMLDEQQRRRREETGGAGWAACGGLAGASAGGTAGTPSAILGGDSLAGS